MDSFKMIKEVVLYNSYGCEIAREEIKDESQVDSVVGSWIIYVGDRIEIIERESEI